MAGPWEKYQASTDDGAAVGSTPWERHSPPTPQPETSWRNLARNVAAGAVEGGTAILNAATDPFGTVIAPVVARIGGTAYDAGARVFGYPPMTPEQRNDLYNLAPTDVAQQPLASRVVNAADTALPGPKIADVQPNTPTEQLARKVAAASVAGGAGGPGAALVAGGGAATGDVAARLVPDWAQPGAELAGNVAGGVATSRALTPRRAVTSPERDALVASARDEGIPLSAGEVTGSKPLQKTEQMLSQAPGSAGGYAADAIAQQRAFNRAALRRAGIDADIATPEVLRTAQDTIGGTIKEIANRNTLLVSPELMTQLAQIEDSLRFLPRETASPVKARLDQLMGMLEQPPGANATTIPGASYRLMDSQIGRNIRSTTNGDLRAALMDLRGKLRTAMDASISADDAADWATARRQYANLQVIRDAVSGAGAGTAEGNISPLALRGAVDRSTGGGYEMGQGDLNQLARIGQSVLRKPSDSGSPAGIHINRLLSGGAIPTAGAGAYMGGVEGAMMGAAVPYVAPWVIGGAMRSRPGQAFLTNQLTQQVNPLYTAAITAAAEEESRRRRVQP